MSKSVNLEEAAGSLLALLAEVEQGEEVVITRDGTPVARLTRAEAGPTDEERRQAIERLKGRMSRGWPIGAGPLNRDELHER